jgi:cell division septum initiation protein DivIVA
MDTDDDPMVSTAEAAPVTSPDGFRVARLLEVAVRNADELLAHAKSEADQLMAATREQADQLLAAARTQAQQVRTDLEETRAQLQAEIARLEQLEHESRDRIRQYLTEVLAQIDKSPPAESS